MERERRLKRKLHNTGWPERTGARWEACVAKQSTLFT